VPSAVGEAVFEALVTELTGWIARELDLDATA
jgi:hypothetical protein